MNNSYSGGEKTIVFAMLNLGYYFSLYLLYFAFDSISMNFSNLFKSVFLVLCFSLPYIHIAVIYLISKIVSSITEDYKFTVYINYKMSNSMFFLLLLGCIISIFGALIERFIFDSKEWKDWIDYFFFYAIGARFFSILNNVSIRWMMKLNNDEY
jgi:Na+-transporting methylmalonyl-CoA/oxaloacetate decarboxylase gamma subunit